jgi:hypothetical protein
VHEKELIARDLIGVRRFDLLFVLQNYIDFGASHGTTRLTPAALLVMILTSGPHSSSRRDECQCLLKVTRDAQQLTLSQLLVNPHPRV